MFRNSDGSLSEHEEKLSKTALQASKKRAKMNVKSLRKTERILTINRIIGIPYNYILEMLTELCSGNRIRWTGNCWTI